MYFNEKNFESVSSWSMIDNKPVLIYIEHCDDYVVFWNGFKLSHKMALCLAMTSFSIFPTPEMREALHEDHKRLYYAGAFQTNKWNKMVANKDIFKYLAKQMKSTIATAVKDHTLGEVLGWFSYDRAVKI